MTRRKLCFILFPLFLWVNCWGQNVDPESPHLLAIRTDRLIEVGSGNVIANAVVLIEGERIKAVGSKIDIPKGAQTIDLGNVTILPGLIDCHTHLLQSYYNEVGDGQNIVTTTTLGTPTRALLGAFNARGMLEAGFTAVRDVGNSGAGGDVALRNAIESGWVPGPRMAVSTRALAPVGGQFDGYPLSPETRDVIVNQEYRVVTGTVEATRAVREAMYEGADLIKVIVGVGPNTLSLEEMNTIVTEAHRGGKRVAAHAVDDAQARIAAEAGVDSIEHGYGASEDVLKLMASKKIFLVPTDGTVDIHSSNRYETGRLPATRSHHQKVSHHEQYQAASKSDETRRSDSRRVGLLLSRAARQDPRPDGQVGVTRLCRRRNGAHRRDSSSHDQCGTPSWVAGSSGQY